MKRFFLLVLSLLLTAQSTSAYNHLHQFEAELGTSFIEDKAIEVTAAPILLIPAFTQLINLARVINTTKRISLQARRQVRAYCRKFHLGFQETKSQHSWIDDAIKQNKSPEVTDFLDAESICQALGTFIR